MKRLLSCALVVFILLINVIPCSAANASLSVGVADYSVTQGEPFTVSIKLSGDSGLSKLSFSVNYSPECFEYVAGSGKTGGIFSAGETFTPSNTGTLSFSGSSAEAVVSGGTILSFTLKLKPQASGGVISISVSESADIDGNYVAVTKSSVKINCDHGNAQWVVTQEPTCVIHGKKEIKCSCGYSEEQFIDPNDNHTFEESKVVTEPTCTKTGLQVGTCTACGESGAKTVIPALGHQYSDWTIVKEPTADTMGIRERVCKTCGDKESQMVAPMGSDEPVSEEISTDITTQQAPVQTTEPQTDDYFEIETEPSTEKQSIFGDNVSGSNIALVAVVGLTILIVGFLVAYLLLLRKKK